MQIFAHRGIFNTYPENSYGALEYALKQGCSVETDLRITKDGDFIIIHDDTLERLCGENISVNELTLEELKEKHYISKKGHKLPDTLISFRDYCNLFIESSPELQTAVQVKADSQSIEGLQKVSDYFEEFNLYNKAFVFDLTLDAAAELRKRNPKIKNAFIISEYRFESTIHLWDEVKDFPFEIVWAAEYKQLYSKEFIDEVKSTGRSFYAMSPDVHKAPHILHARAYKGYEETWKDLINWRAEGICTDEPLALRNYEEDLK